MTVPPTSTRPDVTALLTRAADLVAPALDAAVGRLDPELHDPVRHHLAGGGKRVRAALVLVSATAAGGSEDDGIPGAVAIELVHNFSLVHDDIIDDDRERRHRPTVWAQFGVGRAIIAGDALAALATEVLLADASPERVLATRVLATATQQMIAGQALDMAFESRSEVTVDQCLHMLAGKTGALLGCAAAMGAVLAGAPEATVAALDEFGRSLGIAFQAVDDVLGIWGNPDDTGKAAGNDLVQQKKSLPVVAALERSGDRRSELAAALDSTRAGFDVDRAAALVEELGGREATVAIADSYLGTALDALHRAQLQPVPLAQLEAIAHFVTERDR